MSEARAPIDLAKLREPFELADLSWRLIRSGRKDGKIWAKCIAYITSRAIIDRLDEACGPQNWASDFRTSDGHLLAGIGIRIGDEWVWKWDGTGMMDAKDGLSSADAGKGDFSNALKRAAVQWGTGRYLYDLKEDWAIVNDGGRFFGRLPGKTKEEREGFRWDPDPSRLPDWALPGETAPLLQEMRELLTQARHLGVGTSSSPDKKGLAAVELAISRGDLRRLGEAKGWLQGAVEAAKKAAA